MRQMYNFSDITVQTEKKSEHKVKKNTSEKDTTDSEIVPKQVVEY